MSEEDLDNTPLTLEEQLRFARAIEASPRKIAEIEQRIADRDKTRRTGKTVVHLYVHGSDETTWEMGQKIGLKGEALSMFSHALDEIKVTLEVDMKTGLAKIVAVDDRAVSES